MAEEKIIGDESAAGTSATVLEDILHGLGAALENLQKDDVTRLIPGKNLDEMLLYIASQHPEPQIANFLVHELKRLVCHD